MDLIDKRRGRKKGLILSSMPELQDHNKEPHYLLHWLELWRNARSACYAPGARGPHIQIGPLQHRTPCVRRDDEEERSRTEYAWHVPCYRYVCLLLPPEMASIMISMLLPLSTFLCNLFRVFNDYIFSLNLEWCIYIYILYIYILVLVPQFLFYLFNIIILVFKLFLNFLGGKVVAALASVCGIIVLAFPISMIIDKFAESTGEDTGFLFIFFRIPLFSLCFYCSHLILTKYLYSF
uniref:Uncharacterized protein n=1 Tax=Heterorhabditis bacteriophora TaxID=37862 RepID=A0A1I7WE41_HETBA